MVAIVFLVLKLCGVIQWPWIWVVSPIWITLGLGLLFLLVRVLIVWADNLKYKKMKKENNQNGSQN